MSGERDFDRISSLLGGKERQRAADLVVIERESNKTNFENISKRSPEFVYVSRAPTAEGILRRCSCDAQSVLLRPDIVAVRLRPEVARWKALLSSRKVIIKINLKMTGEETK